ncbi:MAG: TlpA family protein disulfide reductase [Acidobacteriota bacterium]|nr:TlpA family protein disulfide reductase [Acidobacteriota bacterium]
MIAPQRTAPRLLCTVLLLTASLMLASAIVRPQSLSGKVTLEGQLVCSECWFEADRKTIAYGTPADIQCATDCAVKGIPPAVAVKQGDEFRLYLIEAGKFKQNSEEWLTHIGKWVQVSGRLTAKKDKQQVAVDELKVLPSASENVPQTAALGSDPELTLKDLFGVEQKLSAYRGKIVVLNFWATWCIPCRQEMPDLAAIQTDYAALGVQVIGAGADTLADRSKVLQFVKETRINFPVWLGATTDDMKRFGLGPALPGTAIIGRDGKIVALRAAVITQTELKKQIDNLLAADAKSIKNEIASARSAPAEASLVPS